MTKSYVGIFGEEVISLLLSDKTTKKNLIWATGDSEKEFLTEADFTGGIKARAEKSQAEIKKRIRDKAEVFTPAWICNRQNNLVDCAWFGYSPFNEEEEEGWKARSQPVIFPQGKSWQEYVEGKRLEMTCGEAPYLVSRYDSVSGKYIPLSERIGLLDRKLRIVGENVQTDGEWLVWAKRALDSVYAYDWQGDNVLLARENLLSTFIDYYLDRFQSIPAPSILLEMAEIIAWNVWQMDGEKNLSLLEKNSPCQIQDWQTKEIFPFGGKGVAFDAIVGNPPYQMMDGGAQSSAKPTYQHFVLNAVTMNPRYLSVIMPARWYAGGKGLDSFRKTMLGEKRISHLVDFSNSADCFPALGNRSIKGGICYFLWQADYEGKCEISSYSSGKKQVSMRYLKEKGCEIFLRDSVGVSVLQKVRKGCEKSFSSIVSTRKPFAFPTNFTDYHAEGREGDVKIYANKKVGYIEREKIQKNIPWIDAYKLYIPEAIGNADVANDKLKAIVGEPNTCCTETYLVIGPFEKKEEALHCLSYVNTRFFHFLLALKKISQHTTQKCYEFIPLQSFEREWRDEELYQKYGLSEEEITHIEQTVWGKGGK